MLFSTFKHSMFWIGLFSSLNFFVGIAVAHNPALAPGPAKDVFQFIRLALSGSHDSSEASALYHVDLNENIVRDMQEQALVGGAYDSIDRLTISEEVKQQLRYITYVSQVRNQQLETIMESIEMSK